MVVCHLQYLGLVGGKRGIDMFYWNMLPYLGHYPACVLPPTYLLQITHISLLCTVCDREISEEFPKIIDNTTKENIYIYIFE